MPCVLICIPWRPIAGKPRQEARHAEPGPLLNDKRQVDLPRSNLL